MAKSAEYSIVINGIKESIDGIQSINKQLDDLEKRLDAISKKNITVSVSGGGGSNAKALDEEAKILQKIDELHQKVAASEREEYQELLHAKEELKEYQTIAKSLAAQDNLKSGTNNLNTMQGMKAQLHDLKAAMQTVDINGDQFRQWAAEANELNQKLKEVEQSYGVFSRDVGNYSNGAYEGIKKFSIEIGGVTKEFESAKKALKELKAEMQTLQYKQDKGIITEEETERFKSLVPVVRQLESAIQDAGKPLDNMLDTMQSLVAIASVGQGLSALFGLDESEIEKTIQKLVALQNVLQGLQTIQNQITSKQGIGLFLSKGSGAIDSLTKSIFGVTAASKNATIAVKLFSGALKGLGFGLVMAGISALIDIVGKWITKQQEAKKEAEELRKETNKNNASLETTRLEMQNTLKTLESFNGSKKEEERIVKDLNSKYGQALGTYKTIAQWKDALKQKTDAYIESLEMEFEMQQAIKKLEDAYLKKKEVDQSDASDHWSFWNPFSWGNGAQNKKVAQAEADKAYNDAKEVVTNLKKKMDEHSKKNQINLYSPQSEKETKKKIKDDSKNIENAVREAENNLNDLEIKLMNDGLMKQLRQLEEENRRVCAQIRKNGVNVGELIKRQEQYYAQERKKIIDEYVAETDEILSNAKIDKYEAKIEEIENKIRDLNGRRPINPTPADNEILSRMFEGLGEDEAELFVNTFNATLDKKSEDSVKALTKFMDSLKDNPEWQKYSNQFDYYINTGEIENATNMALQIFKKYYGERVKLIQRYGADFVVIDEQEGAVAMQLTSELSESLESRLENNRQYFDAYLKEYEDFIKQQKEQAKESENTSYKSERDKLIKERDKLKDSTDENEIARREAINKQIEALTLAHKNRLLQIEIDADDKIKAAGAKFYDMQLASYNDFLSAMSNLADKQPVMFKSGFVNIKATKANFEEVKNTAMQTIKSIDADIEQLQEDFDNGLIDGETYQAMLRQFTSIGVSANQAFVSAEQGMENAKEKFRRQIMEIAEQVSQTAQQMISVFGDLYNYNIQKELDAIDKINEKLDEKLEEQREIEERHKNEIESIEDELAESRGDRRQQLIDQLNAEMQARREAAAEQKRIEAEMKANERKQEELEKKKARAQWKRDIASAIISGAMAAANGYATKPFLPTGLAMGALATTLAAAQVAIIRHNKPYAKGGLLEGPSHKHGGIPVGNTGIEVEGKEYVIRKESTAKNVNLLDFINKSRRKLTLSDFIDYYEGRKNNAFRNMSGKYAEGGQLPTMPNIDLGDVMTDVAILRDNRPIYVAVTDINKKQDDVRRVQVLSGLK